MITVTFIDVYQMSSILKVQVVIRTPLIKIVNVVWLVISTQHAATHLWLVLMIAEMIACIKIKPLTVTQHLTPAAVYR